MLAPVFASIAVDWRFLVRLIPKFSFEEHRDAHYIFRSVFVSEDWYIFENFCCKNHLLVRTKMNTGMLVCALCLCAKA